MIRGSIMNFNLSDSYISVIEAIKHASAQAGVKTNLDWINTEDVEKKGIKVL